MSALTLVVPGDPVPKGRPRVAANGHVYTPKRTAEYEAEIGYVWVANLGRPEPFTGPVSVAIEVRERVHPSDLDNYVKVCLDALNDLAWADDKQVEEIKACIHRGHTEPGITITVEEAFV